MPVTFDAKPLELFSNVGFKSDNAIIQLGEGNKLKSDSSLHTLNLFRWMRGSETRQSNNEIRTQLLKSLGDSLGVSGMRTGENGEITFSKEFMDKLEKLLGSAFRREDFGVPDQGGAVTSGKPLTARRLKAIYASAGVYDTGNFDLAAYKQKIGAILQEQFGIKTTLGLSPDKFEALTKHNTALAVYAGIEKSLDFLQNDFKEFVREEPDFHAAKGLNDSDEYLADYKVRFQVKDPKTGKYEDMMTHSCSQALQTTLRGNLVHTERANFTCGKSKDIDPLKKYIENALKGFIKNGIDAYMEAKLNGMVGELMEQLKKPGACTEEKGMKFYQFRQKHFQQKVDTKLEAELNSLLLNTATTPFDKVLEAELETIQKTHPEFETWKQFGPELNRRLVGLRRPAVTLEVNNGKTEFVPVKDKNGDPVIRAITSEDVERLGKMKYEMIYGED